VKDTKAWAGWRIARRDVVLYGLVATLGCVRHPTITVPTQRVPNCDAVAVSAPAEVARNISWNHPEAAAYAAGKIALAWVRPGDQYRVCVRFYDVKSGSLSPEVVVGAGNSPTPSLVAIGERFLIVWPADDGAHYVARWISPTGEISAAGELSRSGPNLALFSDGKRLVAVEESSRARPPGYPDGFPGCVETWRVIDPATLRIVASTELPVGGQCGGFYPRALFLPSGAAWLTLVGYDMIRHQSYALFIEPDGKLHDAPTVLSTSRELDSGVVDIARAGDGVVFAWPEQADAVERVAGIRVRRGDLAGHLTSLVRWLMRGPNDSQDVTFFDLRLAPLGPALLALWLPRPSLAVLDGSGATIAPPRPIASGVGLAPRLVDTPAGLFVVGLDVAGRDAHDEEIGAVYLARASCAPAER
jgi:hypothetical protein